VTGPAVLTRSPGATRTVGGAVAALLRPGDVVVVAGELGAGKTTFVQGVAAGLGVADGVVSPTFTLAREYEGRHRLVHVDLYRLSHGQEVLDLGLEELGDDAVLLVEWGDVALAYLPAEHLEVRLTAGPDVERDAERLVAFVPRGRSWLARRDALVAAVGAA
jgi:tRNA threonylcarbamoyladenosine biosynthesis protein TsaE